MAVRKLREDYMPVSAAQSVGNAHYTQLRERLLEMHPGEQTSSDVATWSPRNTVAFIVVASAALWTGLIMGVAQILHLLG
jgi:hypothetical protein